MRKSAQASALPASWRALEKLGIDVTQGVVWIIACGLLLASMQLILKSHSIKYPAALIVTAAAVSVFMVLKDKYAFAIFSMGFTLPFFVQFQIVRRDNQALGLTGTFIVTLFLLGVAYFKGGLRHRPFQLCRWILVPALLFLCAGVASMVNTSDRTLSLIALEREAEMPLVFLILINVLTDVVPILHFLRGLSLSFAIECLVFVVQNILGYSFDIVGNTQFEGVTDVATGRIGFQRGTLGASPHAAAEYFCVWTLFFVGLYLCRRRLPTRVNPIVGMIMGGVCLLLAAKRAPFVGFALGLVTISILVALRARWAARRLTSLVAILAVPTLVLLPLLWLRMHQNNEAAYEERMNLTRVAWNMYSEHPVVGAGAGTYDVVKRQYLPDDWKGWLYEVHNRYLLVIAETGSLGLGVMLLLYLIILWRGIRGIALVDEDLRPIQIALVAIFVALYWEMFWHMFDSKQQSYLFWFMTSLSVALPRVFRRRRDPARSETDVMAVQEGMRA